MVITQYEYDKSEYKKEREEIDELIPDSEEQIFQKKQHNFLYKILRYNPFDLANDLLLKVLKKLNLREKYHELSYWGGFIWAKEAMRKLWSHRFENVGGSMFPEYGGAIMVGNHQSHIDPFFIGGSIHRPIYWMSKEENFQTPIIRSLFKNLCAFKLKRGQNDQKAWERAKSLVTNGKVVGIFPEGTRTMDGEMGEFHTGAIRLAIETGVPIVPSAVIGSRNALPKGKLVMKPAKVFVRVGKPIYYKGYADGRVSYPEAKRLSAELREIILDLREGRNPYEEEKKVEELSIGSPKDIEKKSKSKGFMGKIKSFGKDFLKLIDDSWYALIKSLEIFDVRYHFQEAIHQFSANMVHEFSNLMMPYRMIDFDEYIPKEGAAVVCCNHNSEWDVLILATSLAIKGRILYQMAKQSLFKIPVVNAWIRTHHAFPLRRGESDTGSYLYAKDRLLDGQLVVVYPEGTTNNGGGVLLPGHTGAMRLAIEAKVPILLIGITGTEDIYPKHAKMLNFGKGCILKMGEPFMEHEKYWDAEKPPTYEELKELTGRMMARIKDLMLYDSPDA